MVKKGIKNKISEDFYVPKYHILKRGEGKVIQQDSCYISQIAC